MYHLKMGRMFMFGFVSTVYFVVNLCSFTTAQRSRALRAVIHRHFHRPNFLNLKCVAAMWLGPVASCEYHLIIVPAT